MPTDKRWWITLIVTVIIAPILVGGFSAYVQYVLIPSYFEKEPQLSYTVETPLRIFDENTNYNASIMINNIRLNRLYGQPVRVWNSGRVEIENLDIDYSFKEDLDKNFNIFAVIHNTSPQHGIKIISSPAVVNSSREFSYDLLNPNDEFTALFLIDKLYQIEVTPRKAGLTDIRQVPAISPTKEKGLIDTIIAYLWFILSFITLAIGLMTLFWKRADKKML